MNAPRATSSWGRITSRHGRSPEPLPAFRLAAGDDSLELVFPDGWLDRHPLTRANLEQEAESLKAERLRLTFG